MAVDLGQGLEGVAGMVTAPSDLVLAQSPGSPRSPRPSVLRTASALGSTSSSSSSSSAGSSLAARVSGECPRG